MRIERQRIGAWQTAQDRTQLRTQIEEGAVRPVDVMPQALAGAEIGNRIQRIDRPGVGRAGARHHGERDETGPSIGRDCLFEHIDPQPETLVGGNRPHAIGHDTCQLGRFENGVMRLIGGIQHARSNVGAQVPLPRAQNRVPRRHRPTGGEQPARAGRKGHPLAKPFERIRLELHQCRRGLPDAGETVRRIGDEVRQRRWKQSAARDEREISGARRGEGSWHPVLEQLVEERIERRAMLGRRLPHRAAQGAGLDVAAARLLRQADNVVHAPRHHGLGHRAHLLRGVLEIYWIQSFTR